jgi:protein LSM14
MLLTSVGLLGSHDSVLQSHYSQPASTSMSLPTAGGAVLPDLSSQAAQYGLQRPSFQSNLPLYQPGSAPWGSPAVLPGGNASTLSVPSMYWQGYYAPSRGLPPHMQQPALLQPGSGLSVPQNLQYPGLPSLSLGLQKLSELQPSLMQPPASGQGPSSGVLPASTAPASATFSAPENSRPLLPNMGSLLTPVTSLGATSPFASHVTPIVETSATVSQNLNSLGGSKAVALPGSALAYQTVSQSVSLAVPASSSTQMEMPVPLLNQSGQLLQNKASVLSSSLSMEAPLQMGSKEVKPVEPKAKDAEPLLPDPLLPDPPSCALPENKEPILPLPKQAPQSVCWNFCCCLNTDNLLSVIILIIFWVCIIFYSCLDLLVN